jgi:hypothetical protein
MEVGFPKFNKKESTGYLMTKRRRGEETCLGCFQDGSDGLLRRELLAMTVHVIGVFGKAMKRMETLSTCNSHINNQIRNLAPHLGGWGVKSGE